MGNANTWTTADLVSDVQLISHVPLGNNTFTASEILRLATLEIQTPIIKQVNSTRGNYYLTYADYEAAADGLFDIPSGCVAGALYLVQLIQDTTIIPVNPIELPEQFSTNAPSSTSYGFYMIGNQVQILPTPSIGTTRLWYVKRTSNLVQTTAASQITAVNSTVISVSSVPATFAVGTTLDACGDQPPFNVLGTRTVTDITGTDITLSAAVDDLAVGDWLALEGQTPIPQIPVEFRILLTQRVVVKIYELQGYLDKMKAAQEKLKEYEQDVFSLITPRVSSSTKIIHPTNGGFLGGNRGKVTNYPAGRNQ